MSTFRTLLAVAAATLLVVPVARTQQSQQDSTTLLVASSAGAQQFPKDSTKKDSTKREPAKDTTTVVKVKTPALDFSGWVFGNYQYETDAASQAANGGSHANKFDLERAYLTFQMPAGKRMSVRVTTDIKQGQSDAAAYQGWFVRLKYAYLQWDYALPDSNGFSALARFGILHTVLIDHEEGFWPRWVSKAAPDRLGFFSSADVGAATLLTLPHSLGQIYGTITNGAGYEAPEANSFKDFALRVSLTPFGSTNSYFKTLTISPWGYVGNNASTFVNDPTNPIASGLAKNRYGLFVGIKDRRAQLGAEWAEKKDDSDAGSEDALDRVVTTTTGRLYDGFAVLRPLEWSKDHGKVPSIGLLARYDHFAPSTAASGYQEFWVGGIFWDTTPKTSFSLDYQKTTPKGGMTGNPTELWYLHWQVLF